MIFDPGRGNGENKKKLLKAVQQHLAKVADDDFDGDVVIVVRRGYFGSVKKFPRSSVQKFDPRSETGEKKLLIES